MASVVSQLIEEVTAHAQSDSLEDAGEICADGTYFPNNLRIKPYARWRQVFLSTAGEIDHIPRSRFLLCHKAVFFYVWKANFISDTDRSGRAV